MESGVRDIFYPTGTGLFHGLGSVREAGCRISPHATLARDPGNGASWERGRLARTGAEPPEMRMRARRPRSQDTHVPTDTTAGTNMPAGRRRTQGRSPLAKTPTAHMPPGAGCLLRPTRLICKESHRLSGQKPARRAGRASRIPRVTTLQRAEAPAPPPLLRGRPRCGHTASAGRSPAPRAGIRRAALEAPRSVGSPPSRPPLPPPRAAACRRRACPGRGPGCSGPVRRAAYRSADPASRARPSSA